MEMGLPSQSRVETTVSMDNNIYTKHVRTCGQTVGRPRIHSRSSMPFHASFTLHLAVFSHHLFESAFLTIYIVEIRVITDRKLPYLTVLQCTDEIHLPWPMYGFIIVARLSGPHEGMI